MNLAAAAVEEAVKAEAPDWDDAAAWAARFKAFSGQRSDWAPRYFFWRDLIVRVARRLGILSFQSSEVKNLWFARGGLTPLCLNQVLIEMHKEGHILLKGNLIDPVGGQIYRMLFKIGQMIRPSKSAFLQEDTDECLVLKELLQEKSNDVIKILSESHWTSSCVITLHKFESICGGSDEASMILSYLVQCGTGQYFSIKKGDFIQGVKVSLVSSSVPPLKNIDFEILHLISTMEKMQKQLDVIDQRWGLSRKSVLAAFTSGNKPAAYRHIRCAKLLASSRDNYASLLNRVEEVLGIITQSETIKLVAEAIQTGARVIRNQQISIDQVHQCLEELDEISASQKQVDETLGSASIKSADVEDECLEEEFNKLQLELLGEKGPLQVKDDAIPSRDIAPEATLIMESASSLAGAFSHLHLTTA